ncbi:uncharacterized protein V1510DRAFT_419343 [Dipodascopsis tothii]|uniref:uncharacterized protein n=1 Tax=Dipodascopsis tothii TaxID=44089 RepID=UPI0034CE169D
MWWRSRDGLPPALQARRHELMYEVTDRRGEDEGALERTYWIVFHDYSQTAITVVYWGSVKAPTNYLPLTQEHRAPPPPLRQDQLEGFYSRFGAKIRDAASGVVGQVVGDGEPQTLLTYVYKKVPGTLRSAGVRTHGAAIYVNLANASVQQFDEIRPGDVVSFRNAKFQGHKGGLHQKYSVEVGKPDHCAVVLEWDGTKRKVKVVEQAKGRVRVESYRLGDLKSGEVKVYRVVGREYVGWKSE